MKPRVPDLPSFVIAGALLVAVAGCGPPAEDTVSSGVWGNATVVEEIGIGTESGADEYMFGFVYSVAVADDGTIYVTDAQLPIVRAYDENGSFLRNIGRPGQGPEEYSRFPPALRVLADGTLVMWDRGTRRVSFFSAEGQFIESFPGNSFFGGHRLFDIDVDGNLYLRTRSGFGARARVELLLKYSAEGEQLDRIEMPPQDAEGRTFYLSAEGSIGAFQVMTFSAWSPLGYIVTGRNEVYDIELPKPEGTVHLRRDLQPIAVGAEERAEWEAFRQTVVAASPPDRVPGVKPFFRDIFVGAAGRVWVFRYVTAEKRHDVEPLPDRPERPLLTWREPWTYDVFEPDGTFLGAVVVPELFRPFVFRGDRIWGALADEDGVERVVRLRVVPESR